MTDHGKLTLKRHAHFMGPEAPEELQFYLCSRLEDLAPERIQWLIEFGAVYVNHKRQIVPITFVGPEDIIRVHFQPKRYNLDREELKNRVVHETDDFLIVDKPSGLPMHPTLDNLRENLISGFDIPLYITHRLDVPTSGLVLIAKTKEYQKLFNQMLTDRKITKRYKALVEKDLPPQEVVHFMSNGVKTPKKVFINPPDSKSLECRLLIRSSKSISAHLYELEIELLTGRTHQIRAQLSALGAPILGDEMYGGKPAKTFGLRSTDLEFVCPVGGTPYLFRLCGHGKNFLSRL